MANGYLRHTRETTNAPGNESVTPTPATKKTFLPITSWTLDPGTEHLDRKDELRNINVNPALMANSYAPEWGLETRAYPDVLASMLTAVFGAPTTTAGNGTITDLASVAVPSGAYRHRWTDDPAGSGATPVTSQFDAGYTEQSVYWVVRGAAVSELEIETPEDGGATISASGPATYADRQSDPSLSPTYESLAIRPFTRGNLTIPTNLSSTGTTEDFSLSIANPVEAYRSLGIASRWPDTMEYSDEGVIEVSGSIPKRVLATADIDALKNATGFPLLATWVSESIVTGSYPYKFCLSVANAQYRSGGPGELGNRRRIGMDDLEWVSTSTDGSTATTFEVVNATASYA